MGMSNCMGCALLVAVITTERDDYNLQQLGLQGGPWVLQPMGSDFICGAAGMLICLTTSSLSHFGHSTCSSAEKTSVSKSVEQSLQVYS
jgi:hypothetical protein